MYKRQVQDCYKGRIIDRIMLIAQLMASGRFFVVRGCDNVIAAFSEALWDSKHEDTRLDDGTSDIDTCDAVSYTHLVLGWLAYRRPPEGEV